MVPADVYKKDENRLWVRRFGDGDTYLTPQIPNGAMVRASSHKTMFDKGYMPNWNKEHLKVSKAVPSTKGTKSRVYKLMDYNDETVIGSWYPEEIQEISYYQYRIKKVLRRRTLLDSTKQNYLSGGKVGQTSTTRG